jgi:hypothetical protein
VVQASSINRTSESCGISLNVCIPGDAPICSTVTLEAITVSGLEIPVMEPHRLPLQLLVSEQLGLSPPFSITEVCVDYQTPFVSKDDRLFVPISGCVVSYSDDGKELRRWDAPFGSCAVAVDDSTGTIVVGNNSSVDAFSGSSGDTTLPEQEPEPHTPLSAIEPVSLWTHGTGRVGCGGIFVIPTRGIIVYASYYGDALVFLRLSDGSVVRSLSITRPIYTALDATAGLVFASSESDRNVYMWKLPEVGASLETAAMARSVAFRPPEHYSCSSPLAVASPQPGCAMRHLIVAAYDKSDICVLEIPSMQLIFHGLVTTSECRLKGIATDSCGSTLVLCDIARRGRIAAIPWPLPGMPPLR